MSLIYRALKQTEHRVAGTPASASMFSSTADPVVEPKNLQSNRVLLACVCILIVIAIAIAIGLMGVLISRLQPKSVDSLSSPVPAKTVKTDLVSSPATGVAIGERQLDKLPTMELAAAKVSVLGNATLAPSPTVAAARAPMLTLTRTLASTVSVPVVSKLSTPAPAVKPIEPAFTAAPSPSAPALAVASSPANKDKLAAGLEPVAANVNIPELFDVFNRALLDRDIALAKRQLLAIQSNLPEFSIARLRAEAWFAQQTAEVDAARRLYLRLLEKLPGDEAASVNLATIERNQLRFDAAKDALTKALRNNPNSTVLRAALDQIAQNTPPK